MMNNTISPVLYDFDSLFEIHRINCSMNQDIIEVLKLEAQENPKEKDVTIYTDFIFDTTLSDNMDTLEKFKSCTVYIGSNDENRYGNLNNSTVKFYAKKGIHAKFILISPNKVCLTSANLSWSDWLQEYVFFESEEAYQYLLNAYENYVKNKDLDAIKPNTDDYRIKTNR